MSREVRYLTSSCRQYGQQGLLIAINPYLAQGSVYPRLEITDLKKQEPKQFSLFIQALNNIKKPDYTSKGSDAANWAQIGERSNSLSLVSTYTGASWHPRRTVRQVEVSR